MLILESPAKVNLGLWILGKRSDGFHEILTLFHEIDLCDRIYISEGALRVETNTGIPQEHNLVYRGIKEFERITGREVRFSIFIEKHIPEGGGLGGGSSNLAVSLKAINRLSGTPLSEEELTLLLSEISSDAPFFLRGGSAIGRGKGEILEQIQPLELELTLLIPQVRCSTAKVYSMVGQKHLTDRQNIDIIISRLKAGDLNVIENPLGELAAELYPEVKEALRFLRSLGVKPLVSGTGSAIFYVGKALPQVRKGAELRGWRVIEVRSRLGV
jgi:4-diphosphocytidyl-2-C-methyl-D-erythritol kinase